MNSTRFVFDFMPSVVVAFSQWFKEAVHHENCDPPSLIPDYISKQLFGGYSALHDLHQKFLSDLEDRFTSWEARNYSDTSHDTRIDDLMLIHVSTLGVSCSSLNIVHRACV